MIVKYLFIDEQIWRIWLVLCIHHYQSALKRIKLFCKQIPKNRLCEICNILYIYELLYAH